MIIEVDHTRPVDPKDASLILLKLGDNTYTLPMDAAVRLAEALLAQVQKAQSG